VNYINKLVRSTWAHVIYLVSAVVFIIHLLAHALPFAVGGYFIHDALNTHDHIEDQR
jgi:hypothetical protein